MYKLVCFVVVAFGWSGVAYAQANAKVPTHYDGEWMLKHTASVTAVSSGILYFRNPYFVDIQFIEAEIEATREASYWAEQVEIDRQEQANRRILQRMRSGASEAKSDPDAQPEPEKKPDQDKPAQTKQPITLSYGGVSYDVVKVIPLVRDSFGHALEVKTVKWGSASVLEVRKDVFLAKYSGQPISTADIKRGDDFIVVLR